MADQPPPDPDAVSQMRLFDWFADRDPRYKLLFTEIGLDTEQMGLMRFELINAYFDAPEVIEHQIRWLNAILRDAPPVKRRNKPRDLTRYRPRGKV